VLAKFVCVWGGGGELWIKNLEDQNHYLLMKFVQKLHDPSLEDLVPPPLYG
jgi:hypothetical protein